MKFISLKAKNKSMDSTRERDNEGQFSLSIKNFKNILEENGHAIKVSEKILEFLQR